MILVLVIPAKAAIHPQRAAALFNSGADQVAIHRSRCMILVLVIPKAGIHLALLAASPPENGFRGLGP